MQPYSRLSGCASDLTTALTVDPVLSGAFIGKWDEAVGIIKTQDSSSFILQIIRNDTLRECSIDRERRVVNSFKIYFVGDTASLLLYDATFSWGMIDDTIPYLEDLKISGYSQYQRGLTPLTPFTTIL